MSSYRANAVRNLLESNERKILDSAEEGLQVEVLHEAYASLVRDLLHFEDEGWLPISGSAEGAVRGLSLSDLRGSDGRVGLVEHLEKQTKVLGDLLGRGLRLKNNHVLGRGFRYERADGRSVPPRDLKIMEDPKNAEEVFSISALKTLNRVIFTSGNLVLKYDKIKKQFQLLSIGFNIENWISEDEDPSTLKYLLRTWEARDDLSSQKTTTKREWVPVSTYEATRPKGFKYPKSIMVGEEAVPVNKDAVIIFKAFNKDNGETFGVPDAFAAAAPAAVYADYMKSGAKLQHALAAISFIVKAKTQAAAKSASAKLQNGRVAQAAITGPDTQIQSLPRAGSINLYEGRPLAARVASALDVSTTGITSDTGTGGSYASENALSAPEQMSALSRQEDFSSFFAEVFRVMGSPEIIINWNRLDPDPLHRALQSLGLARTLGGINQEEFRSRVLELLDIDPTTTDMPVPDEFTGSKYATLKGQIEAGLADDPDADTSGNGIAAQGVSGSVGSLADANSTRDDDDNAGTA